MAPGSRHRVHLPQPGHRRRHLERASFAVSSNRMNPQEVTDTERPRGVPSVSYSITVRLEVPAGGRAVSQLTTAVEHAGGAITALDVTASGHERLRIDVTCAARRLREQLDIPVFHDDQHGT